LHKKYANNILYLNISEGYACHTEDFGKNPALISENHVLYGIFLPFRKAHDTVIPSLPRVAVVYYSVTLGRLSQIPLSGGLSAS
jgi:hypothetical protein